MAEPSGEYDVACSVDLSPIFGKIENKTTLTITKPPADILEQRLEELESDDVGKQRTAAYDLAYFPDHGKRVFTALLSHLDDQDESLRSAVFSAMGRYTDQIEKHIDVYLKILVDDEASDYLRRQSTFYVCQYGPIAETTEKALDAVAASYKGHTYEDSIKYYVERYRDRKRTHDKGKR